MKVSLKRITSSGSFIPEIDGLRFIAITSVFFFHLSAFLSVKDVHHYADNTDYYLLKHILSHGNFGVPLFFVISGYVLGIPFAKFHIEKGTSVNLKKYFLRRLTRLEPPYILIMTVLLLGAVYVAKTMSFGSGIKSYLCSVIYAHNFIFPGMLPKLNTVAWSLEIEVQFYILAPLMAYIFSVRPVLFRRLLIALIAIIFVIINHSIHLPFRSLINYLQYFAVGFLLADLYISRATLLPKTRFDYIPGLFLFVIIWIFDAKDFNYEIQKISWEIIQLASIFFLYYYVLFHKIFKMLSLRFITNIGGMCYSIYLLHYPIISMFGNAVVKHSFSKFSFVNVFGYAVIFILLVLSASSLFFLLVERPCMKKDWYRAIFKRPSAVPAAIG